MRLIELRSPLLDPDAVALSFVVHENLSQEPSYQLDLLSRDSNLDFDALLGSTLSADIDLGEGDIRTFNTHVFGGYDTGQMSGQYTYTLELRSWLSFLAENRNSRIFQDLSVPQIVEQVFQGHQRNGYRFELEGTYEPREYCVQFQETDLNFVKRLLEDEGIYFWVEHEPDRHVVVISDTQRFEDLPLPNDTLEYLPDGEESRAIQGREGVQRLQRTRRIKSNNVALRDFDYHAPSKQLDSDAQVEQQSLGGIPLEYYDYAAGYRDPEQGERLARLRLEAIQADAHALGGEANARALAVGRAFTLVGHPALSRNRRYYVTNSELTFIQDGPDSTSQGRNVAVKFRALADDQPFRPLLVTKRPRVPGIQSATVVGPEMSEVHTDKLGRIRVHFHWDRYKTTEADASCWIRVTQAWAGKGWGVLAMPRVGQEVIVVYVDGDLDRPLATGIVYNGENPTPYDLPKDIRYTGLVTRSIKRAGGIPNASQLTFDDQHGAERVMIHAERDLQQTVERNSSTSIAQDLNLSVKGTSTSVVGISVSFTGISVSYTGLSVSFTGVSASFTGVSTSFTGVSTSFTGVSTSFTGVDTSFTGVSTGFKGVDTSFTGVATSMVGVSTSITGSSNSVTGVSNSMTGISSSWKDVSMSTTGQSESITGVSLSYTGTSNSMTGTSTSVTGTSTSITGTSMSNTGSSTSITGTSMSTTGSSVSTTGSSMSATGSSVGTTGSSVSTTGSKMSVTGFSFSYTGASYEDVGVDLKKLGMQTKN
ncbi:type VI secretion system Vgr family protein [Burkholderia pseudomallei]|uniref:type VI secretion system Vgr family protein n=10 Tax=pseudomallei group TaxID=111527 RepID=UPI000F0643E5|nr:type VI secretion system tip protein VgrG [Burkholderia pseudomallei]VCD72708.1 Rhs element Vgr protein [Burkholderia pseudomallei]VCH24016.1 Rhs element Vgr protein [Burkholderia pseudomallei]VCN12606.1 Rhs element Vgr protein [Burkholderia pseudomallei]VCP72432.1 Rhs element Vgr protein [Burkholderia pseudomallei]